jgi:hypothetical protein
VVMSSVLDDGALDAATGTVNSVQNVLVRFPEVDVAQEVRGMWFNCCCTSGRLSR